MAGAGAVLAVAGLATALPQLSAFAIPIGVIGGLLAGTGLYDAFKADKGPVRMLLFPEERMTRTTSQGLPFDDANDLEMLQQEIKNSILQTLEGKKEGLLNGEYYLSTFVLDDRLWKETLPLALPSSDYVVKWAKLVKFDNLVPVYPSETLSEMVKQEYYAMKDGQMLLYNNGWAAVYDTLNASTSSGQDLFSFDSSKKSILRHEYITDSSNRHHGLVRVPGSRLVVLRMKYCRIAGVKDQDYNSLRKDPTNPTSEDDVWRKMAYDSGYNVYSWKTTWPVYGYNLDKLANATIQRTNDEKDIVYMPATGWQVWRELRTSS